MKLRIEDAWSPDPDPTDVTSFDLLVQVALAEVGKSGHEVFSFRVCSSDLLAEQPEPRFISHTLVLPKFSWPTVSGRIERLLAQVDGAANWADAILILAPYLRHNDSRLAV